MNSAKRVFLWPAAVALTVAGCGSNQEPVEPAADAPAPPAEAPQQTQQPPPQDSRFGKAPPADTIATVFGRGTFTPDEGAPVTFAFDVNFDREGAASGALQFSRFEDSGKLDVIANATCGGYDIASGRAWVGGQIETNNSTADAYKTDQHGAGQPVWFRFAESMQHPDPAAQISMLTFGGTEDGGNVTDFCESRAWPDDGLHSINAAGAVIIFELPGARQDAPESGPES